MPPMLDHRSAEESPPDRLPPPRIGYLDGGAPQRVAALLPIRRGPDRCAPPTAPVCRGRRDDRRMRCFTIEGRGGSRMLAPHRRSAFSSIASNTGARSPGEALMTCSTSAVAVCCSSASRVSVMSRAFSIAMTACAANFATRDLLVGKRSNLLPVDMIAPRASHPCFAARIHVRFRRDRRGARRSPFR